MKPLIYGYMRVMDEQPDDEICRTERELRRVAEAEGYCFVTIFHEYVPGPHDGFDELMRELRRADAHHVIVPSLAHLSSHRLLRDFMLAHLESRASAQVVAVKPEAATDPTRPATGAHPASLRIPAKTARGWGRR